jgi:hypothetical protein
VDRGRPPGVQPPAIDLLEYAGDHRHRPLENLVGVPTAAGAGEQQPVLKIDLGQDA